MRNLCPVDSYVAACSLFKTCHAATVERNLIYFINDNEICKLEMDSLDPEKDVCLFFLHAVVKSHIYLLNIFTG